MASNNNPQEITFSATRKKVDMSVVEAMAMDPKNTQHSAEVQSRSEYNLRHSLAWDSAFFTSPGVLDADELFETLNFRDVDCESGMASCVTGRLDRSMRKSLAWDSSFFNSPGVLDDEELCVVNRGFRTSGMLRCIEEEILRSVDSSSTALRDTCSLESLEISFCDDITTSMHNEPPSNMATSAHIPKTDERHQIGRSNKLASAVSRSSSRMRPKKVASNGHLSLLHSHRPPTGSGSSKQQLTTPSPKVSKGTKVVKGIKELATSAAEKRVILHNKASLSSSIDFVHGSSPSRRTKGQCHSVSALCTTPLKHSSLSKSKLNKSVDSTCSLSTPLLSSRASPASSVDRWPLHSPLVTSKQRPNKTPSASLETSPRRGTSFDSDVSDPKSHNSHSHCGNKHHGKGLVEIALTTRTSRISPVTENVLRNSRSSGLRVPSPKIGYFDAENSVASAPKRVVKSPSMIEFSITNIIDAATSKGHEGGICIKKKRQLPEGNSIAKIAGFGETVVAIDDNNKENVAGHANQVKDLTNNLEAIGL